MPIGYLYFKIFSNLIKRSCKETYENTTQFAFDFEVQLWWCSHTAHRFTVEHSSSWLNGRRCSAACLPANTASLPLRPIVVLCCHIARPSAVNLRGARFLNVNIKFWFAATLLNGVLLRWIHSSFFHALRDFFAYARRTRRLLPLKAWNYYL